MKDQWLKKQVEQKDYRDIIEQDIQLGVDQSLLSESQLIDLHYYVSEHLRKFGYDTGELPKKTIPPREGLSTRRHGKRRQ